MAKRAVAGYLHNIIWSDFGFFFSWKCMKWVEQEDHRAIGRPSLMRIASEGQFSGRWMREFRVPCTRKQRREGVTVHSYHGAMPCLMHTGEHGAFAGFQQIRPVSINALRNRILTHRACKGLFTALISLVLEDRVVAGFSRWSNSWGGPGVCFISKC